MKKMKKMISRAVLLIAVALMATAAPAFAENEMTEDSAAVIIEIEAPAQETAAAEDAVAEEASAPAEEAAPVEEAVIEEAPVPAEEAIPEAEAADSEEAAQEAAAENELAPIEDEIVPQEEEAQETALPFMADVQLEIRNEESLKMGDAVEMRAKVSAATMEYTVAWEQRDTTQDEQHAEWQQVGSGKEYTFIANESVFVMAYRLVLVGEDGTRIETAAHQVEVQLLEEEQQDDPAPCDDEEMIEALSQADESTCEEPSDEAAETEQAADDETVEFDDYETPLGISVPMQSVSVSSSCGSVVFLGETITLTGTLYGYDGYDVTYQWECDRGAGFEPVDGAMEATFSFQADANTLQWNWRLTVSVVG